MNSGSLRRLVEDASERRPADGARRGVSVVDVNHAPATVAGSEQSPDGDADLIELAPHTEFFECAKPLRLDEQPRAQWLESGVFLENFDPMAQRRQRNGGRQTGGAGPGNSDIQFR
jgi:hypothetical protein